MPLDAPVTIATFVLTGESSPDDVARPSICCPKGISLSFGRLTIIESIAKGLRSYSRKGAILTESNHNCGGIRAGLPRRFCGRCSKNVHGSKNHSLARYRSENWKLSAGGSSLLLSAGALATGVGSIPSMPERYARNEFGCIRFLQRWYVDQGRWRGQPSSCRERAAEFESASSQIVTVWDLVLRRKAVEIEERERELGDPHRRIHARYFWSGRRDLNSGPPAPKAGALPGCATPRHEVRKDYKALPNRTVAPSDQLGLQLCQNCAK